MTHEEIEKKVKEIIANQLGINANEIKNEAHLLTDLGADSLDAVELTMSFEDEFGITIPDKDAEKLTKVNDAIKYMEEHTATKS